MTHEVKILYADIMRLYLRRVPLPEEFGIQLFEWGMEHYAMGERYHIVRRLCDEIASGQYHPPEENSRQSGRLLECMKEARYNSISDKM